MHRELGGWRAGNNREAGQAGRCNAGDGAFHAPPRTFLLPPPFPPSAILSRHLRPPPTSPLRALPPAPTSITPNTPWAPTTAFSASGRCVPPPPDVCLWAQRDRTSRR